MWELVVVKDHTKQLMHDASAAEPQINASKWTTPFAAENDEVAARKAYEDRVYNVSTGAVASVWAFVFAAGVVCVRAPSCSHRVCRVHWIVVT